MEIIITPEQEMFTQKQIQNGQYSCVNEVIRTGLLLLDGEKGKLANETEKRDIE